MLSRNRRNYGFTFVELIIAAAILSFAMIPVIRALTISHSQGSFLEQHARSTSLATATIERIRAESVNNYNRSFSINNKNMGHHYLCSVIDTRQTDDLRKITVNVGYDSDQNGNLGEKEIKITLSTYVARKIES